MASPSIPLPPPGEHSPENYMLMSRRFIEQSRLHLDEDDRLQASEKISLAVAASVKAIAEKRGWQHDSHGLRDSIVTQLGSELGRSTEAAQVLFMGRKTASEHHRNSYENTLDEADIRDDIPFAESLVEAIELLLTEPPKPVTVARPVDAHRIGQLTGYEPPLGATDALGFANFTGEVRTG